MVEIDHSQQIIEHLDRLNQQIAKQNSFTRMFVVGMFYGVGFFVGSAIIATIALGIFGPLIGRISWVQKAYTTGVGLMHSQ